MIPDADEIATVTPAQLAEIRKAQAEIVHLSARVRKLEQENQILREELERMRRVSIPLVRSRL